MDTYVPVKERKIKEEELTPVLEVFPWFMPGLRKRLYTWYPGPEICMHRMHWSEWLFGLFFLFSLLLLFIGADHVPTWLYGLLLLCVSVLAMGFVWGFAKYKSLASAAERLERVAMENHTEVQAYKGINEDWDKGLQDSKENLCAFTRELGFIEADADKIAEVEQSLTGLVTEKKRMQAQEKALFQVEVKYQRVVRGNIDEQKRHQMKDKLLKLYERIDRRGDKSGLVDSPEEIAQLRKALEEDELLNTSDDKGSRLFHWEAEFDQMAADGRVERWELLEALDRVTHAYYLEIKNAVEVNHELQEKLGKLQHQALKKA